MAIGNFDCESNSQSHSQSQSESRSESQSRSESRLEKRARQRLIAGEASGEASSGVDLIVNDPLLASAFDTTTTDDDNDDETFDEDESATLYRDENCQEGQARCREVAEFGTAAGGRCGIFGNAQCGKGTLLAAASSTRPKVANYPFTTIVLNLGVCDLSRRRNGETQLTAEVEMGWFFVIFQD